MLDQAMGWERESVGTDGDRPGVTTEGAVMTTSDEDSPQRSRRHLHSEDLGGDPFGHDHSLSISAWHSVVEGLTVRSLDDSQWPADDMVTTYQVEAEHIDGLRTALGAGEADDLLELLARGYEEGWLPTDLGSWLKVRGVEHTSTTTYHDN
jgi:hypothetical protein